MPQIVPGEVFNAGGLHAPLEPFMKVALAQSIAADLCSPAGSCIEALERGPRTAVKLHLPPTSLAIDGDSRTLEVYVLPREAEWLPATDSGIEPQLELGKPIRASLSDGLAERGFLIKAEKCCRKAKKTRRLTLD